MYYVKKSELQLWTVGLDTPIGWQPIKDFDNPDDAQEFADERNGLRPLAADAPRSISEDTASIATSLASIAESLAKISTTLEDAMPDGLSQSDIADMIRRYR